MILESANLNVTLETPKDMMIAKQVARIERSEIRDAGCVVGHGERRVVSGVA